MAHIVTCMVNTNGEHGSLKNYISRQQPSTDSLASSITSAVSPSDEKKPFTWRMYQPEARKYQLFPKEKQPASLSSSSSSSSAVKQPEPEPMAAGLGQPIDEAEKTESADKCNGLRLRIKEHNLTRRRKVSVPELGPMTTVHEVAMDSPTIPGRPPLHERSASSPVNSWRQPFAASRSLLSRSETVASDSSAEPPKSGNLNSKQPLSPKSLAPLVIPTHSSSLPGLARKLSLSRLRSGSAAPEPPCHPSRSEECSPKTRTPYTPMSASTYAPTPNSTATGSSMPTPMSAMPTPMSATEARQSPMPWDRAGASAPPTAWQPGSTDATAKVESEMPPRANTSVSHRRNHSDTGSIMERGRPRKRSDGTPVGGARNAELKRKQSIERRAFETLPQGWRPSEAVKTMDQSEAFYLHKQALSQAQRFEVLKKDDVESLSKELRHLDERTDYLRRTYTSLRAGRRNLHSRICQFLRSPRTAKFSYESMLKQEEALAELDASIDDWVTKLEHAENRRTRVRQKLLEHVAAAATMAIQPSSRASSPTQSHSPSLAPARPHHGASELSTPPRSPNKMGTFLYPQSPASSPQRVVARVPSAIPEVPLEEADATSDDEDSDAALKRMESIRIYADSDVYALLADVESEFTKLSAETPEPVAAPPTILEESEQEVHRARSHELLDAGAAAKAAAVAPAPAPTPVSTTTAAMTAKKPVDKVSERSMEKTSRPPSPIKKLHEKAQPPTPPAPSPPTKNSPPPDHGEIFLTAAVFRPPTVRAA